MKPKITGHPAPEKYNAKIELDSYRKFSFRERLKILLGYRALIRIRILCRHSPGHVDPLITLTTTKEILSQ